MFRTNDGITVSIISQILSPFCFARSILLEQIGNNTAFQLGLCKSCCVIFREIAASEGFNRNLLAVCSQLCATIVCHHAFSVPIFRIAKSHAYIMRAFRGTDVAIAEHVLYLAIVYITCQASNTICTFYISIVGAVLDRSATEIANQATYTLTCCRYISIVGTGGYRITCFLVGAKKTTDFFFALYRGVVHAVVGVTIKYTCNTASIITSYLARF